MSGSYESDVSVEECWTRLREDPDSFLIDVRTGAEWAYVGVPALRDGIRPPLFAEWQTYPTMAVDPDFATRLSQSIERSGGSRDSRLYFLCRSGARSMATAAAMTAAGYRHCFNIEGGFEGPPDEEGHRGRIAGWKAAGLPWVQK